MATRQWLISTNGTYDFNNPIDWQFDVVPSLSDIAQFNTGAVDTITGNAEIAELLITNGRLAITGAYTISGAQATELSLDYSGFSTWLTILPGAAVIGNQAVSVTGSGAVLSVEGELVAGSLTVSNQAYVKVYQGSTFDVAGPITMSSQAHLVAEPAPGQAAGAPITIASAIQTSGGFVFLTSDQPIEFDGVISGTGNVALGTARQYPRSTAAAASPTAALRRL
jgi:hypothetical protein